MVCLRYYGQVKSAGRSRMGHASADKRVFCHETLHLKQKLQTSKYTQTVEKWDTDSDSDLGRDTGVTTRIFPDSSVEAGTLRTTFF